MTNRPTTASDSEHDHVLPHADLMVSHVGHGSLCAAARHGVPILALPWGRDQHVNAQTLTDLGLGLSLPSGSTAEEIADAAVIGLGM